MFRAAGDIRGVAGVEDDLGQVAFLRGAYSDALERHAPACRLVVVDAHVTWPARLRWPELASYVAVVGPQDVLLAARAAIEATLRRQVSARAGELVPLGLNPARDKLAHACLVAWVTLHASEKQT